MVEETCVTASSIGERLGRDDPAYSGRARFWFDTVRFSSAWFRDKLDAVSDAHLQRLAHGGGNGDLALAGQRGGRHGVWVMAAGSGIIPNRVPMPTPTATTAELTRAFVYFGGLALLRYVVFVALWAAVVAWLAGRVGWRPRLQTPALTRAQWGRELRLSAAAIVIAALIAPTIVWLGVGRQMPFYRDIATHGGWLYFGFSIVLMLFIRDALFY